MQLPTSSPREAARQATTDHFQNAVRKATEEEIGRIIEEEAASAKQRVEDRIFKLKAELAQRVLSKMTFRVEDQVHLGRVQLIVEL